MVYWLGLVVCLQSRTSSAQENRQDSFPSRLSSAGPQAEPSRCPKYLGGFGYHLFGWRTSWDRMEELDQVPSCLMMMKLGLDPVHGMQGEINVRGWSVRQGKQIQGW